jgi:hypothetical protein
MLILMKNRCWRRVPKIIDDDALWTLETTYFEKASMKNEGILH